MQEMFLLFWVNQEQHEGSIIPLDVKDVIDPETAANNVEIKRIKVNQAKPYQTATGSSC